MMKYLYKIISSLVVLTYAPIIFNLNLYNEPRL